MGPNDGTDERNDQKPKVEPEVDHVNRERRQLVTPGNVIIILWKVIFIPWNVILALVFMCMFVIYQSRKCTL